MKIIRAALHTHNEWFRLQMCKDRFESLLQIDSLKQASPPLFTPNAASKSNVDRSSNGSSQVTISSSTRMSEDGSSPTQVSSRDVACDENAILKVMVRLHVLLVGFLNFASATHLDLETTVFSYRHAINRAYDF